MEGRKKLLEIYRNQPLPLRQLQKQQYEQHLFDVNGDGVIDLEEARLARILDKQTMSQEVDIDGDGVVSQDEKFIERQIAGREMIVQDLVDQIGGPRNFGVFGHRYRGMSENDFKNHAVYHAHHHILMTRFRSKERGHRLNGSDQIAGCWKHQEQPRMALFPHQVRDQSWLAPPYGYHYPYGRTGVAEPEQVRVPDINKIYPMPVQVWNQRQWG